MVDSKQSEEQLRIAELARRLKPLRDEADRKDALVLDAYARVNAAIESGLYTPEQVNALADEIMGPEQVDEES
jgi:hypothetical protein